MRRGPQGRSAGPLGGLDNHRRQPDGSVAVPDRVEVAEWYEAGPHPNPITRNNRFGWLSRRGKVSVLIWL